ncbi:MAG: hypothetical protein AAGE61_21570 [Pseudomonadota bacterium]
MTQALKNCPQIRRAAQRKGEKTALFKESETHFRSLAQTVLLTLRSLRAAWEERDQYEKN